MGLPRDNRFLTASVALLALVFVFIVVHSLQTSCPFVPPSLGHDWRYLSTRDGMKIYDVAKDPNTVVSEILSVFPKVYYYSRAPTFDLNLSLPDVPADADLVYMVTVKPSERCGFETFAVVGSAGRSRIYVGTVPISSDVQPMDSNTLYCNEIATLTGGSRFSEVMTAEGNRMLHWCYAVSGCADLNKVAKRVSKVGRLVGLVAGRWIYTLDDNTVIQLVPGDHIGVIAYRVAENAP